MKIYAYLASGLIILALLAGGAWFSYKSGVNHERAEQAANREKEAKKDEKKVEAVIKYKEKLKTIYKEKIKYVKTANDKTGCLDADLRDIGLSGLLKCPYPCQT